MTVRLYRKLAVWQGRAAISRTAVKQRISPERELSTHLAGSQLPSWFAGLKLWFSPFFPPLLSSHS